MGAQQAAQSEVQKMQSAIEANTKLRQISARLQELREQAGELGRNTNRQPLVERVFVSGFQAQRQILNDFDLAFGRRAQHGEMFAHDMIPIRHNNIHSLRRAVSGSTFVALRAGR
jgi:hypothetical protein